MASSSTPKPTDTAAPADAKAEQAQNSKTGSALEEDDEFEDFPVEGTPNP